MKPPQYIRPLQKLHSKTPTAPHTGLTGQHQSVRRCRKKKTSKPNQKSTDGPVPKTKGSDAGPGLQHGYLRVEAPLSPGASGCTPGHDLWFGVQGRGVEGGEAERSDSSLVSQGEVDCSHVWIPGRVSFLFVQPCSSDCFGSCSLPSPNTAAHGHKA